MSDTAYFNKVYDLVCQQPISQRHLRELKEQFNSQIKSVRRLDAIASVRDLLEVLKKRACIDSQNFGVLEDIAHSLNINLPSQNNAPASRTVPTGIFAQQRVQLRREISQNQNFVQRVNRDIVAPARLSAKERAYSVIASEIGQKWKNFARSLGIHEGQLDDLEVKYAAVSDRVYTVLYYFEENCDHRQWRTHLLEALADARRKDLRLKVNSIFDTHM